MNEFSGYAVEKPHGWWAMVRFSRDGKPKPILGPEQKPIVYPDELAATKAVLKHTFRYFNGDYRRDGVKCEAAKVAAERLFRNGRKIEVERKVRASA